MPENTRTVFEGRIVKLNLERVSLPNGKQAELEVVHHPGGVAVVLQNSEGKLCLLRQYRHVAGGWIWEFPAGKLETGLDILANAKKEVLEETGATAKNWQLLGKTISSPGIFTEVIHLYYASGLSMEEHAHEAEEVIEINWFSVADIHSMILSGEIIDAKTIIGFYLYQDKITV